MLDKCPFCKCSLTLIESYGKFLECKKCFQKTWGYNSRIYIYLGPKLEVGLIILSTDKYHICNVIDTQFIGWDTDYLTKILLWKNRQIYKLDCRINWNFTNLSLKIIDAKIDKIIKNYNLFS